MLLDVAADDGDVREERVLIKFKFVDIGVVAELARTIDGGDDGVCLVIKHYLVCWRRVGYRRARVSA